MTQQAVDITSRIRIEQSDCASAITFRDLDRLLKDRLTSIGRTNLWPLQQLIIGQIAFGTMDTTVYGGVGCGRTTAVAIGISEYLLRKESPYAGPAALWICPTQESAMSTYRLVTQMSPFSDTVSIVTKTIPNPTHLGGSSLIIGSPGTLKYHFEEHNARWFSQIKLIIYEACERTLREESGTAEDLTIMVKEGILIKARSIFVSAFQPASSTALAPFRWSEGLATIKLRGTARPTTVTWVAVKGDAIDAMAERVRREVEQRPEGRYIVIASKMKSVKTLYRQLSSSIPGDGVLQHHIKVGSARRREAIYSFERNPGSVLVCTDSIVYFSPFTVNIDVVFFAGVGTFESILNAIGKSHQQAVVVYSEQDYADMQKLNVMLDYFIDGRITTVPVVPSSLPTADGMRSASIQAHPIGALILPWPSRVVRLFNFPNGTLRKEVESFLSQQNIAMPISIKSTSVNSFRLTFQEVEQGMAAKCRLNGVKFDTYFLRTEYIEEARPEVAL